jgi:Protein of unknown function (DUF1045)
LPRPASKPSIDFARLRVRRIVSGGWASGLTPRQVELMDLGGYPYVFEQFRFHMTLTGSLSHDQITWITPLLSRAFQGLASDIVELDAISVMRQDDHDGRFRVVARCRLKGQRS